MNALDYLVDFAALVSTSDTPNPPKDGNTKNPISDSGSSATASKSTLFADPSIKQSLTYEAHPKDWARYYIPMTSLSSRQQFSTTAVLHPDSDMIQRDAFNIHFPDPRDHNREQTFDQHLQQYPGLGLPFEPTCSAPDQQCRCKYLPPWTPGYTYGCTTPVAETPYSHQPPFFFGQAQQPHGMPPNAGLAYEFPCGDSMCRCRSIVRYEAREGWDPNERVYDRRTADGYDEWTLAGFKEEQQQFRTRQEQFRG
ncbi:hypothetical protein EJ02DRAFT_99041 [Clathrospora elynae]|uniref:Uncharacterized protein n=1 Tax=Clathrospora elynae TaxID=706981 RepID=A0A6A5SX78_9PLEO|nr:hypothetical protein EJ02DRAFT_99041 [Clathrospora elynae]